MGTKIITWVAKSYGLLLSMAGGGLVGANFFGFAASLFYLIQGMDKAAEMTHLQAWTHGGWNVGVFLALVGAIFGERKRSARLRSRQDKELPKTSKKKRPKKSVHHYGPISSFFWGGAGGALLGILLGGSFLLIWFSLTYSPFAPREWVESVSTEMMRTSPGEPRQAVMTSDHPLVITLMFGPIALLSIIGAFSGLFGGVTSES